MAGVSANLKPPESVLSQFARAPLLPIAVAATCGLVLDRYTELPLTAGFVAALVSLGGWLFTRFHRPQHAVVWLWMVAAGLAAAHHHSHRRSFEPDDIATFAPERPVPVRIRGMIDEEPAHFRASKPDPLLTLPKPETTNTVLVLQQIETADGWRPASGRARLVVDGRLDGLHIGDVVEVVGRLSQLAATSNPGEFDFRSRMLDQRITAQLRTVRGVEGVTRLEEGWRTSIFGWLSIARGWGTRSLAESLPGDEAGLAAALLLGDTNALEREGWDPFIRTGVVHVLAISGQHLVVLAAAVWFVLRLTTIRRRSGAWIVIAVMIAYAMLTGMRPSAVRSAVMVCVLCGGIVLRRPIVPANAFALAWLIVLTLNPTDPFTIGCQLSFLSVFVLIWGAARWLAPRQLTPLEQLIEDTRTNSEKLLRTAIRVTKVAFGISAILGFANALLILASQNMVSPVGILLGPPLVLLTSIALIAGFLVLLLSPLSTWATWPFAQVTSGSLGLCEILVHQMEKLPGAWVYAPGPSMWWLAGFYLGVAAVVMLNGRWQRRSFAALGVWFLFGLLLNTHRPTPDEFRAAFLAVGHGGCVVMETPDGRVLLYDAGTTLGPDSVRRVIAPYLWSRGITRIDEVFLSHADLDHFNGVPELLKRFPIGRVTYTPSFTQKPSPGVVATLEVMNRHGVKQRIAKTGDRFQAGDVTLEVLHPPESGPPGNENTRSLVLRVSHAGHTLLLTGDLEGAGQTAVAAQAIPPVDVMLAPHHGADGANTRRVNTGTFTPGLMAEWARPRFVVSSQEPGKIHHLMAAYGPGGAQVWDTATAGAVVIKSNPTGLIAEAYRSGEIAVIRRGKSAPQVR